MAYKTVQREELVRFLTEHSSEAFTVSEIAERMKADESVVKAPGESTVYRLIKELVESGTVKRIVRGNSRQFVYQITAGEDCAHHLHLKCTVCGKLCHMNDEESKEIMSRILDNDAFAVDSSTVLLGKCEKCRN
ncbi:Fur family transcriptional regulator, ferric uptake regulator [Ruminococcus sp. YE71]|uniref:Fur family transcriptional regulator n=1 Tax=unclassified Ruminococcus TaxID=2608920 RepID=UPI00087FAD12|nr:MULTISPECIES: transcriptional repressor [unclassified Ruminococcus]SDA17394.1 Fur family transcriptional regulator, ferric uptake regulator [Ruminococcus sp. YE78]SFW26749.1 Fur family transcriptional regulator, ferric uptake regulator [Ruminococcus sp. YE71]